MSHKKYSKAQIVKIRKDLDSSTEQLKFYCYETIQEIKELEDLQKHHVFCVLSFNKLEDSYKNYLINNGFQYMATANFLLECSCLYKLLEERPAKLYHLHKQVLRAHKKLHGKPAENLIKDFQ